MSSQSFYSLVVWLSKRRRHSTAAWEFENKAPRNWNELVVEGQFVCSVLATLLNYILCKSNGRNSCQFSKATRYVALCFYLVVAYWVFMLRVRVWIPGKTYIQMWKGKWCSLFGNNSQLHHLHHCKWNGRNCCQFSEPICYVEYL